jgi:hypothetical protein
MPLGSFEWGWDALVAVGTLGLAAGTFLLAWTSRALAKRSAEDVRSQWRPALVPSEKAEPSFKASELSEEQSILTVEVRNVGQGAAYTIDAGLDLGESVVPASQWTPARSGAENLAILPIGESLNLQFTHLEKMPGSCKVIIDYRDLNDRPYTTLIALDLLPLWDDRGTEVLRIAKVSLEDGRERIPWKPPTGIARVRWRAQESWRRVARWWTAKRRRGETTDLEEPF